MRGHRIDSKNHFISLTPGAHVCAFYEKDKEHSAVLASLLKDGLDRNERILYIADSNHPVDVIASLTKTNIDAKHYLHNDQFTLKKSTEIPVRGKDFDSAKLFDIFSKELDKTKRLRYVALRIISEMTCVMLGPPGPDRLTAYEKVINSIIAKGNSLAVCMFDKRRFLPELLGEALKIHPFAIIGTQFCNNIFYIPPEEHIPNNARLTELNHCIKMILLCNKAKPTGGKEAN